MVIDLKDFLLISVEQFNDLLLYLRLPLNQMDDCYMLTYLFANFLGFFLIGFMLYIIKILFFEFWKPRKGSW